MAASSFHHADRGLPMRVGNLGFLLDRLGQDCGPLQFLRELTQNSIQAIEAIAGSTGQIIWDVDWNRHTLTEDRSCKLACIDTGIGMSGPEMIRYINQFSASMYEQAHDKNFGVGAKIAAATRNPAGLVYLSWKDGRGAMTHLWRNPDTNEYELQPFKWPDGRFEHWLPISNEIRPEPIQEHGTMVVLLGNSEVEDTAQSPPEAASPSRWVARYLNSRYFSFPEGIEIRAREGWRYPRGDRDRNLLRRVTGQKPYLDQHAESSGSVELTGALARWWILRDEPALDQNSGYIASTGHVAALYQNELYEMVTARAGVARLQLFGVIFGYKRVVIYVEPTTNNGDSPAPDTARARLVHNGQPLPWEDWAAEFRAKMPDEITKLMEDVSAGTQSDDEMAAIRERLNRIKELFKLSRYRLTPHGALNAEDRTVGGKAQACQEKRTNGEGRGGGRGGRRGDIYALWADPTGAPAEEVAIDNLPEVKWVSVDDGTRERPFLEDRAAKYLPELNLLQVNADFRIFTDMVDRWHQRYGSQPASRPVVVRHVRSWFQQALIETVIGTQALQGSPEWNVDDISKALSEEALTAAVTQRYHIDNSISRALGRALGSFKEKAA